jgi:hypothetical protein
LAIFAMNIGCKTLNDYWVILTKNIGHETFGSH